MEVLHFVAEQYGVIGDLTIGPRLSPLKLTGGRTFVERLQEGTEGRGGSMYQADWGDMVTAAVHVAIQRESESSQITKTQIHNLRRGRVDWTTKPRGRTAGVLQ